MTPRQERFSQGLASGLTATEAYRQAGYSLNNAAKAAASLARHPKIKARVQALQDQTAAHAALGRSDLLDHLRQVMAQGLEKGTLPSVVSAAALYARLCGYEKVARIETENADTQTPVCVQVLFQDAATS